MVFIFFGRKKCLLIKAPTSSNSNSQEKATIISEVFGPMLLHMNMPSRRHIFHRLSCNILVGLISFAVCTICPSWHGHWITGHACSTQKRHSSTIHTHTHLPTYTHTHKYTGTISDRRASSSSSIIMRVLALLGSCSLSVIILEWLVVSANAAATHQMMATQTSRLGFMSHGFWGAGNEGRIGGTCREETACVVSVCVYVMEWRRDCVTVLPPSGTGY